MTMAALDEYAETLMARNISMVSGVAQVQVYGAKKYAVRIQVDPNRLASRQVGLEEVRDTLSHGNVNMPSGSLFGFTKAYTVQSNSQLSSASQFAPMIVAYRNGNPVRLDDLGRVVDSVTSERSKFWVDGIESMVLAVQKQPGANTVEVVEGIKSIMPRLKQNMPGGINLNIIYDASQSIRDSIHDVKFTLGLTIALVILVIFVFLRNFSATLIPSLAVPLSLLGTFAVMKLLGFTIDTLSMMAMTLSVGFVVDDAIVMLENIVRHMEMGKPRMQAALEGAREVGFTIISMTISLVAVFIPVLFLEGIIGRLLREFSVTIAVAVLISGVISLTLTPMLGSRFLRPETDHKGRFYRTTEAFFVGLNNLYRRTLHFTATSPAGHADGEHRADGRHGVHVHRDAEELPSDGGRGLHVRGNGSRGGHLIRRDGEAAAPSHEGGGIEPVGAELRIGHGRDGVAKQRLCVHQPEERSEAA